MICWYCKSLIADNASVCPCCGVAVVNPVHELVDYPVYDEFRQNGYFNPYEEYYRNFQLPQMMPQMNPPMFGQYSAGFGSLKQPQFPASAMVMPMPMPMPMPMQNPFAPFQVVGVIYPQQYSEEPKIWVKPKEDVKPEIESLVKDEPVLILEQSEINGYAVETSDSKEEIKTAETKKADKVNEHVDVKQPNTLSEHKKTNILAIVGFVFAFIIPLIGLILSSVGLSRVKTRDLSGKGIAVAGIVLSIIMAIVYSALFVIFSETLFSLFGL